MAHGHVQGSGNRCGGEGQHIHLGPQGFQFFLLLNAKPVFFVDNHQPQILEVDIALQQLVGANDDICLAFLYGGDGLAGLAAAAEAAQQLNSYRCIRETVPERLVMLLGEKGSGHQHRHLFARPGGQKSSAHGHFGFTKTDIAAHQPVHGALTGHILEHRFDGHLLVWRFLKGKAGGKGPIGLFRVFKLEAFPGLPAGVDIQQLCGGVADFFQRLLLGVAPAFRAQFVQRGVFFVGASVAGNQVQAGHRHIEFGATGVFQGQELVGLAAGGERLQPLVAPHAVVDVHDRCANSQFRQVPIAGIVGFGWFLAPAALQHSLSKQRRFGNQGQILAR